jgi:hypothetical protein
MKMAKRKTAVKEEMVTLSNGTQVRADQIQQIPEGVTAKSAAIQETTAIWYDKVEHKVDPVKAGLLERAFQFISSDNELFKAVWDAGVENLAPAIVAVAQEDLDSAIQVIKYLMRQLTRDAHFRYVAAYRKQMMAAKRSGGGVNGLEINAAELLNDSAWFDRAKDYPGAPDDACTPAEQAEAVQDIHLILNSLYMQLNALKFSWLDGYEPAELPFEWYVDTDSKYHEIHDLYAAFARRDEVEQEKVANRVQSRKAAIGALANFRVA